MDNFGLCNDVKFEVDFWKETMSLKITSHIRNKDTTDN